jgi:hypothetical protein
LATIQSNFLPKKAGFCNVSPQTPSKLNKLSLALFTSSGYNSCPYFGISSANTFNKFPCPQVGSYTFFTSLSMYCFKVKDKASGV